MPCSTRMIEVFLVESRECGKQTTLFAIYFQTWMFFGSSVTQ